MDVRVSDTNVEGIHPRNAKDTDAGLSRVFRQSGLRCVMRSGQDGGWGWGGDDLPWRARIET
ncbi:hypothetical protein LIA77_03718 [Sarocladium implicatum]|jgi:hypothetical protein|nr:hypothetical protein LIA77_03718 [Sarocladium implicatum]